MAPRKSKPPKLTFDDIAAWCNQNGYWLIKQPEIKVGTVQFQVYRASADELIAVLKQTSGSLLVVEDEE